MSQALQFLILTTAGRLNRQQEDAIDYLRLLVLEYVEHYHRERNHHGLGNRLLLEPPPLPDLDTNVRRRRRVGGLQNYYHREAA
jgi:hypothetical protein